MRPWLLSLLLTLLLALAACGQPGEEALSNHPGEEDPAAEASAQQEPEAEPQEPPAPPPFDPLVPAGPAADPAWFDDAAFVGDSVSVMLELYNSGTQVLGTPDFFCTVSLSQQNALSYAAGDDRLPEYPKGSGQHPRLAEGIAASGASKVYLMLGINCLAGGVDSASQSLVQLVDQILALSPQADILIESVTPMTATSPRADGKLNNDVIAAYNARMREICQQRGWYFVNVAEAVSDENGYLLDAYSGDTSMGIHFNYNGAETWANYLLTHVPEALQYSETTTTTNTTEDE